MGYNKGILKRRAMTQQKGFTLTELLVVIGIIALMTAVVIPNARLGNKRLALERSAQKLAQDIGRALELSLRVQEYNCSTGSVSGYGVHFDINTPTVYLLFVDCDNNQTYNPSQDGIVETIELESGVEISVLSINPKFSVVFVPPDPEVFLNPGGLTEAQVTLREPNGTSIKVVKMNNRGLIDVD